jgi:D-alanyl-D-alanine endopeptidase (penicillin-binding protein 7)
MKKNISIFASLCATGILLSSTSVWAREPKLSANGVVVSAADDPTPLLTKNSARLFPIASITKLMTAMVLLDASLPTDDDIEITDDDVDDLRHSKSRVPVGSVLIREQMLKLSLMSSENRAAHALARTYPGGINAFVAAMNTKARALGMNSATFTDPTGLFSTNVASPIDVAKMAAAAYKYESIRRYSTAIEDPVVLRGKTVMFHNTNSLVRGGNWSIGLSKTGFIDEAGRCLVMLTTVSKKPYVMVFLSANSTAAREQDARKVRSWLNGEATPEPRAALISHKVKRHGHTDGTKNKLKHRKNRSEA